MAPVRERNDPRQYDDLASEWWEPGGVFAMLHWIAAARGELIPPARRVGATLVDIACGAGLLAPHAQRLGYRHVGLDLGEPALAQARDHGVTPVRADACALPLRDAAADVVVAGEILEHVADPVAVVDEACRVLKPGGTVVIDTIADTRRGRFLSVTVAERIPGGPPRRLHDPALFVDRAEIARAFARHGVALRTHGLLPDPVGYARWMRDRSRTVRLRRIPDTGALYAGSGVKR